MSIWKEIDGFTYRHYDPGGPLSELDNFHDLIALWQSKREGRRAPAWSDFDFFDFQGWHGFIAVYDICYDPFNYTVRLSGIQVDKYMERTVTGINRGGLEEITYSDTVAARFYEKCCRNMLIGHTDGRRDTEDRTIPIEILELPLSDHGEYATHTIEVYKEKQGAKPKYSLASNP